MLHDLTQVLVEWISSLPTVSIYAVFLAVAYLENIIPPIPGDVLVAFAGYLAAEQVIAVAPVYLLTTIASVFGFMSLYAVGSRWGTQISETPGRLWLLRYIDIKYIEKVRGWMQRWGQGVILANRFLAGTRSVISLTAGISHTNVRWTTFNSLISSALWNGILIGFGWFVHSNWEIIGHYLSIYSRIILAGILLFILVRIALYYWRKSARLNKP